MKIDGKWGYINKTGQFVIKPKYSSAGSFSSGLAPVGLNGRYGYINKAGKLLIELKDSVSGLPFCDGGELAPVRLDRLEGYVDRKGMYIVKPAKPQMILPAGLDDDN